MYLYGEDDFVIYHTVEVCYMYAVHVCRKKRVESSCEYFVAELRVAVTLPVLRKSVDGLQASFHPSHRNGTTAAKSLSAVGVQRTAYIQHHCWIDPPIVQHCM
jgi:hypothetical protein